MRGENGFVKKHRKGVMEESKNMVFVLRKREGRKRRGEGEENWRKRRRLRRGGGG